VCEVKQLIDYEDVVLYTNTTSYNETNHKVIKIRELDGTVYFEASADGITYTSIGSYVYSFDLDVVQFSLDAENFSTSPKVTQIRYLNHDYTYVPPSKHRLRGKCKLRGKVKLSVN
jgi:hypothetical protein